MNSFYVFSGKKIKRFLYILLLRFLPPALSMWRGQYHRIL